MRVLVVTLSPLLRELVTSVLQPRFFVDVVEVLESREPVARRLRDLAPDLIWIGLLDGETDAVAVPLLAVLPSVRVLVLARNGADAWLHGPQGRRTVLSDLSVEALRAALQDPAAPSGN
jgi:chemotaxis response regulator CheB